MKRSRAGVRAEQVQILAEKTETLQRQMLKMGGLMAAATAARVALQVFPFIEPITAAALLAGSLWGEKKGALFGATLIYVSNFFVFGGNGPWTLLQCLGMAMAGAVGARLVVTERLNAVVGALAATTVYDMVTNMMWIAMLGPAAIVSGFPIFLLHAATNALLALSLPGIAKRMA